MENLRYLFQQYFSANLNKSLKFYSTNNFYIIVTGMLLYFKLLQIVFTKGIGLN